MLVGLIGLGGGLGACCRFWLDGFLSRSFATRFPLATLLINALGSFVLGFLGGHYSGSYAAIISTGFCGGFTTFSTYCTQALQLQLDGFKKSALAYLAATAVVCVVLAWLGLQLSAGLY